MRWERLWDPANRRHFYYDKTLHVSSWTKPLLHALPSWQPPLAPREPISTEQAKTIIVRFLRMCRVRWRCQAAAVGMYARYYDAVYKQHFYVNRYSGRSSWSRPPLLLPATELPVEATLNSTPTATPGSGGPRSGGGGGIGARSVASSGTGGGGGPKPLGRGSLPSNSHASPQQQQQQQGRGFVTVRNRFDDVPAASLFPQ